MTMDSDRINRWLTLTANIGVLIGLVVVIYELRQNTEMMRAQINQSRSDTALSEADGMYNSDYMPDLLAKIHSREPLSFDEEIRFRSWARGFHRDMDNMLWQYRAGYITENIPRSIEVAITDVFGR